jgi:hypothetical protein
MIGQGVSSRSSHSDAAVDPLADVLLVLVKLERELRALAAAAVFGRLGDRLLCLCHCRLIAHVAILHGMMSS